MCGPRDSSKWANEWSHLEKLGREFYRRPAGTAPHGLRELSLKAYFNLVADPALWTRLESVEIRGGEPFSDDRVWTYLGALLAAGGSAVPLHITTSGLDLGEEQMSVLARFDRTRLHVSAEGVGELYRYIRGRNFSEFESGFERLRQVPHAQVSLVCTLSAYNVFGAVDLWKWQQARGLEPSAFALTIVERPSFLRPRTLPIETRLRALRSYREAGLTESAHPELFVELARDERAGDEERIQAYQEFVEYTADVDRLRGSRLAHAAPDLMRLETPTSGSTRRGGLSWPSRK